MLKNSNQFFNQDVIEQKNSEVISTSEPFRQGQKDSTESFAFDGLRLHAAPL